MKTNKISSEHEKDCIKVLKCVVPSQKIRIIGSEGEQWESIATEVDEMAITKITKDGVLVAKIVYDYNSNQETEFFYEKCLEE